ncbi:hypothetical protein J5N97_011407 [Dioscorea zingiberensis]|uniref:DUF4220 domain-containing protein n=1 Tax=Dioscorea zingiberensis TaxID=325984 RepID=A0A9D5D2D8_9LILI|nr:hypothetical protein J5N97_011407 [Dioscorea zingiberensis]
MSNTKPVSDYMHYEHEPKATRTKSIPASHEGVQVSGHWRGRGGREDRPPHYLMKLMLENAAAVASKVVTVERRYGDARRCGSKTLKQIRMYYYCRTQIGQKASPDIQLPGEVKEAIVQSMIASGGKLRNIGEFSLTLCGGVGIGHELSWACKLEAYAQIILVWHVATSICFGKASPDPTNNEDQFNHKVADSLSKYCAYLVVFCRGFLPEQNSVTEVIFKRIINETRLILEGQRSMRNKLDKLMEVGDAPETIAEKSGKLGRQLMGLVGDDSLRFRLLREIWVEIVLYIAPSDNTTAHAQHLAEGGEFITHLWTLLCHLGIFERPTVMVPV